MGTYFEVEFTHPEYSPLDPMPIGMDRRYILANSDAEAQNIFRSRHPMYRPIKAIKDTGCSTLEELKENVPWGERIERFNEWDAEHRYLDYNTNIELDRPTIPKEKQRQLQNPTLKDVINVAVDYIKNLFRKNK